MGLTVDTRVGDCDGETVVTGRESGKVLAGLIVGKMVGVVEVLPVARNEGDCDGVTVGFALVVGFVVGGIVLSAALQLLDIVTDIGAEGIPFATTVKVLLPNSIVLAKSKNV